MANEAVPVEGPYEVHDFTVLANVAIEKGEYLGLIDPRTASGSLSGTLSGSARAGFAATAKESTDNATEIGVTTKGFLDLRASGSIPVGSAVSASATKNFITLAPAGTVGAGIIGYTLETAGNGDTIEVAVDIGKGGN